MGHSSTRYVHVVTRPRWPSPTASATTATPPRCPGPGPGARLPAQTGRAHPPRSCRAGGSGARRPGGGGVGAGARRSWRRSRPGAGRRHHAHRGDRSRQQHDQPDPSGGVFRKSAFAGI
jgi:hypothetical protein